ncbi:MAG TPA: serine hydrolase domain-containing protein, partial [Myxococcota bacterium]
MRIVSLSLALLLLTGCATPSREMLARVDEHGRQALHDYVDARVHEEMRADGADAVSVVVVSGDDEWFASYGRKTTPDSRFRVGSISKLMTSLTALSLRDDGLLDLDAPISDALPGFAIKKRFASGPITARALMTHHAGVPSNILRGMYGDGSVGYADHAQALADQFMVRPVGALFSYSDVGFTVLGTALEQAGQKPFADLVAARTLTPLGMTHSSFVRSKDTVPAFVDGAVFDENPPITTPANGLVTTPRDLATLAKALLVPPQKMRARILEAMTPQMAVPLDLDWRTGFGLNDNRAWAPELGPVYWHSGATLAFTAELVVCPRAHVAVIVLTNTREAGMLPSLVAWDVLDAAIREHDGVVVRHQPALRAPSFSADELDSFAGTYPTEYGTITLARDGGELRGRAFDEVLELVPTQRRTFLPIVLGLGVIPVVPDLLRGIELSFADVVVDGKPARALVSHQRGLSLLRGVRVLPVSLSPAWRERVGHWSNPQRVTDQITVDGVDISEDNGFLMARVHISHTPKPLAVPLTPLDDDTALTAGVGRYLGETVRVRDGKLELLGYTL